MSRDLEPFSTSLDDVFARLGLPNPQLMSEILNDWDSMAGKPWAGNSRPVVVRGRTLVVEATSPSLVAFLRYGISDLLETISERFGPGLIIAVEVLPPGRR